MLIYLIVTILLNEIMLRVVFIYFLIVVLIEKTETQIGLLESTLLHVTWTIELIRIYNLFVHTLYSFQKI